jgi:hypothetical protein
MEQFLTPTRRYRNLLEESLPFEFTEVKLTVPVEDFLVYYWDWKDLWAFFTDGGVTLKILWITEFVFLVVQESGRAFEEIGSIFEFHNDTSSSCITAQIHGTSCREQTLILANITHAGIPAITRVVDVFWRAVTTSNCIHLTISNDNDLFGLPSGPLLSQFLRGSPSLQFLSFDGVHFKEDHCRALATLERTNLEITFNECKFEPQDAEETFIEWFRHNQVVTELVYCLTDSNFFSVLRGNNSVKKLAILRQGSKSSEEEMRSLLQALPGNRGIEDLSLDYIAMSDETWSLFFRSLSTHPCIKLVSLRYGSAGDHTSLSAQSKTTRMNAILQMLQRNTVLQTIDLPDPFKNEAVYQNAILPRLEMNRTCFEAQRQAVKQADPSIRPQLLGRALHVVRYNPNLIFHFLSENVPAFVRTEDEDSAIPLQIDPAIVSGQKRKAP